MQPNYTYKAIVTKIIDGDTIDVVIDLGFHLKFTNRLRLSRINTYELTSSNPNEKQLALAGKSFTESKVLNKDVIIVTHKADAFGRYLAEVFFVENQIEYNLSDLLLQNNLAVIFK